jgi:hypothetical protein
MTPFNTSHYSIRPPGIFSILAYLLVSISTLGYKDVLLGVSISILTMTAFTAFTAKSIIKLPHFEENLVPILLFTILCKSSSLLISIGTASSSKI